MNRISFNNYIYISPKSVLYNYNPDNKYHKKLLEKTGDRPIVIVNYNPYDEKSVLKYSSNNYGVYLMQQRNKLTGVPITVLPIQNITISKRGNNYILRGNPDKELLSKIKEIKYKLPNNKTIKTLKRRIPTQYDFVTDDFGWVIQSASDIEGLSDYLPEIEKKRFKLIKNVKDNVVNILNDSLLFTNIRNGESISPADLLFTVKDFYNNPSLLEIKSKEIAPDFKDIVKETKKVDESSVRLLYNIVFNMIDSGNEISKSNFINEFIRLYSIFKQRYPQLSEIKIVIFIIELYMKDDLLIIKNEYKNRLEKSKKIVNSETAIQRQSKKKEKIEEETKEEKVEKEESESSEEESESSEDESESSEDESDESEEESDESEEESEDEAEKEENSKVKSEENTNKQKDNIKVKSEENIKQKENKSNDVMTMTLTRIKNIFDDVILDDSIITNILNTGIGERSAILVLSAFIIQTPTTV